MDLAGILDVSKEYKEQVKKENRFVKFAEWIRHWKLSKEEVTERIENGLEVTYEDFYGYSVMLENKEYEDNEEKELIEERVEGAKYMNVVWQLYIEYLKLYFGE